MKKQFLCIVAAALVAVGCAWVFFAQPEINFRRLAAKYPRGTPAQVILNDFGNRLVLHQSQNELGPDASEEERRRSVKYYVAVPQENAYLFFNYHQELLRVMRASEALKPQ
jgi:hypothetical protein